MSKEESTVRSGVLEKVVPVLLVLSIGLAFMIGVLWQKVVNLEKGGVIAGTQQQQQQPPPPTVNIDQVKAIWDKEVVKFGDKDKKVLFIEAADPSCPYCHIAGGNNPELAKEAGAQFTYDTDGGSYIPPVREMRRLVDSGQASYAYLYLNGHGNGEMAAKALYCAQDQDKFWPVHDALYTNAGYDIINNTVKNDKTKTADLVQFIGTAADSAKLTECLENGKYDARLAEEQALAQSLGVSGTPGFLVNETLYSGAYSWNDMKATVDAALE